MYGAGGPIKCVINGAINALIGGGLIYKPLTKILGLQEDIPGLKRALCMGVV